MNEQQKYETVEAVKDAIAQSAGWFCVGVVIVCLFAIVFCGGIRWVNVWNQLTEALA